MYVAALPSILPTRVALRKRQNDANIATNTAEQKCMDCYGW